MTLDPFTRGARPAFVAALHLPPLPGAPRPGPDLGDLEERAREDARALARGGVDAIIVENMGDAPYPRQRSPAITVAAMTRVALAVRSEIGPVRLGVNVLRNDVRASIAIAHAVGAHFIRINVPIGAAVTDQGILQGAARQAHLTARALGAQIRMAMDVDVKHAAQLGTRPLDDLAVDTWHRAGAHALILTGRRTGMPVDPSELVAIRTSLPDAVLWAGSGQTPETLVTVRALVHAVLVGTWLHRDARLDLAVDEGRVAAFRAALDGGWPAPP